MDEDPQAERARSEPVGFTWDNDRVTTEHGCRCCGRANALFGPQREFNGLPSASIVCDLCARHLGSHSRKSARRDRDHKAMWAEDLRETVERLEEQGDQVVAELETKVSELETELEERPYRIVYKNLDQEEVVEAHNAAERAYRSRDRAFVALTRVHLLHFETSDGHCRCGRRWDQCEEAAIVDTFRALRHWERHHHERRRQGQRHHLPQGHPGIVDARWDPDDANVEDDFDEYERPRWPRRPSA